MVLLLLCASFSTLSCDDYEQLPPKVNSITEEYLLPLGSILTPDERAVIDKQWQEYEQWLNP